MIEFPEADVRNAIAVFQCADDGVSIEKSIRILGIEICNDTERQRWLDIQGRLHFWFGIA